MDFINPNRVTPTSQYHVTGVQPEAEVEIIVCPTCGSEQDESECFLGRLGFLTHFRCRYCGMTFSQSPLSEEISQLASYFTPDSPKEA